VERPGKSQFSIPREDVETLLKDPAVVNAPAQPTTDSPNYVRQVDVSELTGGKPIGNLPAKMGGGPTSVLTVLTDENGNLVNTFPGTLGRKATLGEAPLLGPAPAPTTPEDAPR
jgi:filamentous hemagglutinin